jgi:hypothetical protein
MGSVETAVENREDGVVVGITGRCGYRDGTVCGRKAVPQRNRLERAKNQNSAFGDNEGIAMTT